LPRKGWKHITMTDQTTNQAHTGKFTIVARPKSVTLRQVFGDETRDLRPFLMKSDQILDLARVLDIDLDPTDIASEVTLGSHRVDLLVGINSAGEGGSPLKVAIELQLKPADMPHLRKVLHGAVCDTSIAASVWIAPSFGPDMLRDLAIAQSRITKPLIALEMIPTTSGDGHVWFDYVRVSYSGNQATSGFVGQGAASGINVTMASAQTRSRAGEGHKGRGAARPFPAHKARHDGPIGHRSGPQFQSAGQSAGQPEGHAPSLWAKLATLLNQYDIKASPDGVGRHNQPHCAVGLGRKGAKLVIQLQNKSTKLVMRVELEPEVAEILRPTFRQLEQASGERFTLIPNTQKRKHYQIQVPSSLIDRRASPQDQERAILAFGHRIDKMRTSFRDQLMDLPRETQSLANNPSEPQDPSIPQTQCASSDLSQ
jgi:hypothetical protein